MTSTFAWSENDLIAPRDFNADTGPILISIDGVRAVVQTPTLSDPDGSLLLGSNVPGSVNVEFERPVTDLAFTLDSIDWGFGSGLVRFEGEVFRFGSITAEEVTVSAFDADGAPVDVSFPRLDDHLFVDGTTVRVLPENPPTELNYRGLLGQALPIDEFVFLEEGTNFLQASADVMIEGPVSRIEIAQSRLDGADYSSTAAVGPLTFTASPSVFIAGTSLDDVIDTDYTDDPEGDRVDDPARPGGDRILAGSGDDSVLAGTGDDRVSGSDGDDTLEGGSGNDLLQGGTGTDLLLGDAGNDTLWADVSTRLAAGEDTLRGGDGDDWLYGSEGAQLLDGGAGNDHIESGEEQRPGATDTLLGGDGNDTLIADDTSRVGMTVGDLLRGEAGDDVLTGGLGPDTLEGGDGADNLDGGRGADLLRGGAGDDTLDVMFGATTMEGGAGADDLDGGVGSDSLSGGDDGDRIQGDRGTDVLSGGEGDDSLWADREGRWNFSSDTLDGDEGADRITGTNGAQVLRGGGGDDTIHGGDDWITSDQDRLFGEAGDDMLVSGMDDAPTAGRARLGDLMDGGAGSDTLVGGRADDRMTGGGDNDTFVLELASGSDWITDFNVAEGDRIRFDRDDVTGVADLLFEVDARGTTIMIAETTDSIFLENAIITAADGALLGF